jgi:xanthine dehydrogenase/oxidase
MLDRDEDMLISGQRHAFRGNYKVAFSSKGKIMACELHLYINAGYTLDLSEAVSKKNWFHSHLSK